MLPSNRSRSSNAVGSSQSADRAARAAADAGVSSGKCLGMVYLPGGLHSARMPRPTDQVTCGENVPRLMDRPRSPTRGLANDAVLTLFVSRIDAILWQNFVRPDKQHPEISAMTRGKPRLSALRTKRSASPGQNCLPTNACREIRGVFSVVATNLRRVIRRSSKCGASFGGKWGSFPQFLGQVVHGNQLRKMTDSSAARWRTVRHTLHFA